ncbi:MAG: hypothetical protein A3K67_06320 [Euryarchaeota archaeon RBG_16_62_10]|nr:MAG: hypothetical protein A3K67_06320 [Euryarchaeota archaeon RBG_16_62_10]
MFRSLLSHAQVCRRASGTSVAQSSPDDARTPALDRCSRMSPPVDRNGTFQEILDSVPAL